MKHWNKCIKTEVITLKRIENSWNLNSHYILFNFVYMIQQGKAIYKKLHIKEIQNSII